MTPEAQRIAIAEAFDELPPGSYAKYNPGVFKPFESSLDAMHEAEKVLDDFQHYNFRHQLHEACRHNGRAIYSATAAQRAEAFLRTLNLWTE